MNLQSITANWLGEMVICAASGPSFDGDVADRIRHHRVIAVSDAYKLVPDADMLYAADSAWWRAHKGVMWFEGEKWTTCNGRRGSGSEVADEYDLNVINGKAGSTFSMQPDLIHWGQSSGFQAVNLAILKGAKRIILVGYNYCHVNGRSHFFGQHPKPLNNTDLRIYAHHFDAASKALPPTIEIINATPNSALTCFKQMELDDAIGCFTAL